MNPETQAIHTTIESEPAAPAAAHADAEPAAPNSTTLARCLYVYPNGKRCRLRPSSSGLCSQHYLESRVAKVIASPAPSDSEDLSADLLPELSEFSSAVDVRQFLARLLILVTKARVSSRRAAVLAFISSQLLHSNRAAQKEDAGKPVQFIWDAPRPKRD